MSFFFHHRIGTRSFRLMLPVLLAMLPIVTAGCSFGTRFIFSSTNDVAGTPAEAGVEFRDVWFTTTDDVRLHGWYLPADTDRPLIVFFHGNAANITHRVENLLYFHRLGLPVFIFDYRGYGASEGRALHEEDLYRDARAALRWVRQEGWRADHTIYYGRSLGASVALEAALEAPPSGLVLECAFTSLADIAKETTPVLYTLFGWWSIGQKFDNLERIQHLKVPLLVIHGTQDPTIPWEMGHTLYEKAPQPKAFLSVAGAGHSNCFKVGGKSYLKAWMAFLKKRKAGTIPPSYSLGERSHG